MSLQRIPVDELFSALADRQFYPWTNSNLRAAISSAISYEAKPSTIRTTMDEIMTASAQESVTLMERLGGNNLSSFLMNLTATDFHPHDCTFEDDGTLFAFLSGNRAVSGKSAVLIEDITQHESAVDQNGVHRGWFQVDIPMVLKVRCLYEATETKGEVIVTRLAIAKKSSLAIDDGLNVRKDESHSKNRNKASGVPPAPDL